jgi:hypothetical protein
VFNTSTCDLKESFGHRKQREIDASPTGNDFGGIFVRDYRCRSTNNTLQELGNGLITYQWTYGSDGRIVERDGTGRAWHNRAATGVMTIVLPEKVADCKQVIGETRVWLWHADLRLAQGYREAGHIETKNPDNRGFVGGPVAEWRILWTYRHTGEHYDFWHSIRMAWPIDKTNFEWEGWWKSGAKWKTQGTAPAAVSTFEFDVLDTSREGKGE